MQLSKELASLCVMTKIAYGDVGDLRSKFESLAGQEGVLRRHVERLEALGREREMRQDPSWGGAASEAVGRALPIPHSGGEALVRGGVMGAGGIGGYLAGKRFEPFDIEDLTRVLRPAAAVPSPLGRVVDQLPGTGLHGKLQKADPSVLAKALRQVPFPLDKPEVGKLRTRLGEKNIPRLRLELENLARQGAKDKILPKLKPWRIGGGLAGAGIGAALMGIPLAIRAMMMRRYGGEAAVRARNEARAALEQAEQASTSREELLAELENAA